ncbi:MAG: hypothetical protein JW751_18900 [Polyangiaceae bacterium]|nr:hypothetical protein [Polyangiaceae bacterium]
MVGTDREIRDEGSGQWVQDSVFALAGVYGPSGEGEYVYRGERPGAGWHGHGYFTRTLTILAGGEPVAIRLRKHRWLDTTTGMTCHSRPPGDPELLRFCTLIVFLRVWAWVSSPVGFHRRREVHEGLESGCGSDRTVQRWASRAMSEALEIQQALRLSIMEEVEPRPVESLFRGGLSPPDAVMKRRWRCPADVETLWRACAMLLVAARKLARHASTLLAGARRRWPTTKAPFGI